MPPDPPTPATTGLSTVLSLDLSSLSLDEMMQVQNHISKVLRKRFERERALAFTAVLGAEAYFQAFGDEAGRRLIQRHLDIMSWAVPRAGGRIVDTAGDGAFCAFPGAEAALTALTEAHRRIARENADREKDHRLRVRAGVHWGPVLTDERTVTGDAVNFCARIMATAEAGEVRLSEAAFQALPAPLRVRCKALAARALKGIQGEHTTWLFAWQEESTTPKRIRIVETGQERPLPSLAKVRFGRLAELDGKPANDVVLELPDPALTQKISRWHFELERLEDGRLLLRQGSGQVTEVDGAAIPKGGTAPIGAGSIVKIGGVLTIVFIADEGATVNA
ncbi:MAG TPA: adenylate/guanylate cyclase domain-containing protein [Planctomycetota bacterium]|nr:adenylate/guanylate cyclase domain-containing protein [Planctomycetota bacterium]